MGKSGASLTDLSGHWFDPCRASLLSAVRQLGRAPQGGLPDQWEDDAVQSKLTGVPL